MVASIAPLDFGRPSTLTTLRSHLPRHSQHTESRVDHSPAAPRRHHRRKRLRRWAKDGKLLYPVIAVTTPRPSGTFDNVFGTGHPRSTLLRATSILIAGKNFVVAGYGHCGRGVAMRAQGLGPA